MLRTCDSQWGRGRGASPAACRGAFKRTDSTDNRASLSMGKSVWGEIFLVLGNVLGLSACSTAPVRHARAGGQRNRTTSLWGAGRTSGYFRSDSGQVLGRETLAPDGGGAGHDDPRLGHGAFGTNWPVNRGPVVAPPATPTSPSFRGRFLPKAKPGRHSRVGGNRAPVKAPYQQGESPCRRRPQLRSRR